MLKGLQLLRSFGELQAFLPRQQRHRSQQRVHERTKAKKGLGPEHLFLEAYHREVSRCVYFPAITFFTL